MKVRIKKHGYLNFIIFVFLFSFSAINSFGNWENSFLLQTDISNQFFTKPSTSDTVKQLNTTVKIEPQYELNFKNKPFLKLDPYLYHKFQSSSSEEKSYFDLSQAYLQFQWKSFRFRLGNQLHNWGVLDLYSPADIINTTTLFSPLDSKKRGATGIDAVWSSTSQKFQLLYLPTRTGPQFPEVSSRWLPRNIIVNPATLDTRLYLPESLNYSYREEIELEKALEQNWGTRYQVTFGDYDLQLSYFEGLSPRPHIEIEVTVETSVIDPITGNVTGLLVKPDIVLTPVLYKQKSTAASLVAAKSWGILKFETIYIESITQNSSIDKYMNQSALAFEKQISLGNFNFLSQIQYYNSRQNTNESNLSGSSYRLFDNTLGMGFIFSSNDNLSFLITSIYSLDNSSHLEVFGTKYKFNDQFSIQAKMSFIQGPEDSVAGTYKDNDSIDFSLIHFY